MLTMSTTPFFEPYNLTPLDHVLFHSHIPLFGAFFLDNPSSGADVLEKGIQQLIIQLPSLAGNVVKKVDSEGRKNVYEVQPPSPAFMREFPMLKIKHHLQRIPHKDLEPDVAREFYDNVSSEKFIPLPISISFLEPQPVARFQANVMQNGILLSFCFHHRAMDGSGAGVVIAILATCCRFQRRFINRFSVGVIMAALVVCGRVTKTEARLFSSINNSQIHARRQIAKAAHNNATDYSKIYGPNQLQLAEAHGSLVSRVYTLDARKIRQIKDTCNSLACLLLDRKELQIFKNGKRERRGTTDGPFSEDDIVTSILWLCRSRSKTDNSLPPASSSHSSLLRVVDIRKVLKPPILKTYIGNGVGFARSSFRMEHTRSSKSATDHYLEGKENVDAEDLMLLFRLALETRRCLTAVDSDHVRGLISHVMGQTDWSSTVFHPADVIVSSLRHAAIYRLKWGPLLGRLCEFDIPENRIESVAWIKPAHYYPIDLATGLSDAPWEIRWTLRPAEIKRLQQDKLFRSVSIVPGEVLTTTSI